MSLVSWFGSRGRLGPAIRQYGTIWKVVATNENFKLRHEPRSCTLCWLAESRDWQTQRALSSKTSLPAGAGEQAGAHSVSLSDRFGVAPFSVLNAREGWWQSSKRAWLALGIRSEIGRGENLLEFSDSVRLDGATYQQRAKQHRPKAT